MEKSTGQTAVILLGFGAPECLEDVDRFMKNLTGREMPPERLASIREKYRQIGGGSPLLRIAKAQAQALEAALADTGHRWPVEVGMCYLDPHIDDVIDGLAKRGYTRFIGVSLSPQNSRVTTGAYLNCFRDAVNKRGFIGLEVADWSRSEHYLDALASTIIAAQEEAGPEAPIIFSAHSVPREHVDSGDTYLAEIESAVEAVMARVEPVPYWLSFQSRGGPGSWLEPTTDEVLEKLSSQGLESVIIVAISFISDHLENLYDIDIVYQQKAADLGIRLVRASSLNVMPGLIKAMAETIIAVAGTPGQAIEEAK